MPSTRGLSSLVALLAISTLTFAATWPGQPEVDSNDRFVAYIGADAYQFSPLHRGELGTNRLFAIFAHPDAAVRGEVGEVLWVLEISGPDEDATVVRSERGVALLDDQGVATAEFVWDGSDQDGYQVDDGTYHYTFRARFRPDRVGPWHGPAIYENVGLDSPDDEAYASSDDVVVRYDLDEVSSRDLREKRVTGACALQQNTPMESGFAYNYYYGTTHSHSNYSDGGLPTSSCSSGSSYGSGSYDPAMAYSYARSSAGLDFLFVTDHNHLFPEAVTTSIPPLTETKVRQRYQAGLAAAQAATVDGAFVAGYGFEFGVTTNADQGHVIVLESPKLMSWETCSNCTGASAECTPGSNCYFDVYVPKRYGYLTLYARSVANPSPFGPMGILCHPGSAEFDAFAYNANADAAMQGIAVRSGLAFSTATTCADANVASTDYSARLKTALSKGFHVGPMAESDAHCNNYGVAVPTRTVYLVPNATSPALTRANLFAAHRNRHFFATEDPNLQLVFGTADNSRVMGDIFTAGPGLTLRVAVHDPNSEAVSLIEIWRGQTGSVPSSAYKTVSNQSTYSFTENLSSGTYYYWPHIRQADGHDAWSAPVWVTYSAATTYTISGNAGSAGATITAGSASATSDSSSNYTLSGLAAGTYTVTPSKSGCTFTPSTRSVTLGPSATAVSFTASCGTTTYSISGNAGTAGATVSAGSASATSDSSSNYTLSGLAAGTYTVTPSKTGCTFSPTSLSVTLGPSASGKSFTATCGSTDVALTSGQALANQSVALQAWKYYFITVPSGASSLELKTTAATADLDIYTQVNGKPTSSSYVCRPYSSSGNETCTATSPAAGTWWIGVYGYQAGSFTVTGTVTTTQATYSITGNAGTTGATVAAGSASATSDSSSNYTLSGLAAGTYTVTPSKSGCTFSPTALSVTLGPNATGKSFTATCGTGDTALSSGVTLSGQSVALNAWKYYSITVPAGATSLELKTTSASADVDIYTQVNGKPTLSTYICRPYSSSGNETCTATNPAAGTWWVGVYGYKAATFSVTGTVVGG